MRMIATAVLAGGLMLGAPAVAQEKLVGVWDVTVPAPGNDGTEVWTVVETGGEYAIEAEVVDAGGVGAGMPSLLGEPESVVIDFDGMSFTVTRTFAGPQEGLEFVTVSSGVIDDDTFTGTFKLGDLFEVPMTGRRR